MIQSIFTRPLFINPIGYMVIPELALISRAVPYDFSNSTYIFLVITKGSVEIKFLEYGNDYIMHIDLYDDLGCGVLGEFYIDGKHINNPNDIKIDQAGGMVIIDFNQLPQWFKDALVCWYEPKKQGLTNDEIKKGNGTFLLKDFSKNKLDMTMHNFNGEGMSGMGGYLVNMSIGATYEADGRNSKTIRTYNKIVITEITTASRGIAYSYNRQTEGYSPTNVEIPSYTVKISNLPNDTIEYRYIDSDGLTRKKLILKEGLTILPKSYIYKGNDTYVAYGFHSTNNAMIGKYEITIEQLPLHKDGLVFDGVDDYGISENQPILKDYTWVSKFTFLEPTMKKGLIPFSKSKNTPAASSGAFGFYSENTFIYPYSFGEGTFKNVFNIFKNNKILYQTKDSFNGEFQLNTGSTVDGKNLYIGNKTNFVLYSFLLFNRTLTPEEIDYVKYVVMKEPLPEPIAVYSAKGRSNDEAEPTRSVLPNLAPNGNHDYDIALKNLNFDGLGNWGGYGTNFMSWSEVKQGIRQDSIRTNNKIIITKQYSEVESVFVNIIKPKASIKLLISVKGLKSEYGILNSGLPSIYIKDNGLFEINYTNTSENIYFLGFKFTKPIDNCNVEIELLPQYENGLYFDGVDDYGICEKFPIFTKEKGYTVIAKRKWINLNAGTSYLSRKVAPSSGSSSISAFLFEKNGRTFSFGKGSTIINIEGDITWQIKNKYNNQDITFGDAVDTNVLDIGNIQSNFVLYELHIFDHDLTPYEIKRYINANIDKDYELPQPTNEVKQLK